LLSHIRAAKGASQIWGTNELLCAGKSASRGTSGRRRHEGGRLLSHICAAKGASQIWGTNEFLCAGKSASRAPTGGEGTRGGQVAFPHLRRKGRVSDMGTNELLCAGKSASRGTNGRRRHEGWAGCFPTSAPQRARLRYGAPMSFSAPGRARRGAPTGGEGTRGGQVAFPHLRRKGASQIWGTNEFLCAGKSASRGTNGRRRHEGWAGCFPTSCRKGRVSDMGHQ